MKMVELGNIAEIIMGQSPPGDTYNTIGDGWPFFQGKTEFGKVSPIAVKWCTAPKKIAQEGDILISVRAPVGPTNLADKECCIGRGLAAIRPNVEISDRDFVWLYLQYSEKSLVKKGQGSTFEAINGDDLNGLEVPNLPLTKQRQIAARLKAQLAEVDKARQAAEVQLRDAEALANACMRDVFDREEAKAWPMRPVGEISQVTGGIQKTPARKPVKHFRPFLTVRNVQRGYFDLSVVEQFEITEAELEKYRLEDKDILIVEGNGSPSHIGRNALFKDDGKEWIHQNHIIRVRINQSECLPEFASAYLNSEGGKAQMMEKAETTSGLYTLSTKKVMALEIPVPPLSVQVESVAKLENSLKITKEIAGAVCEHKTELELLPQKILSQAFEQ